MTAAAGDERAAQLPRGKSRNLIWLDLEMTGLRPERDRIIEIAMVVTDESLRVLACGPELAIHQSDEVLAGMDEWNTSHHTASGLVDKVRASNYTEAQAEDEMLSFLEEWTTAGMSPMCGNSICQDRRFLYNYMPRLEAWFHYRNLDVSTVKILVQRWAPGLVGMVRNDNPHRAGADVLESIRELRHYREHLFGLAVEGD